MNTLSPSQSIRPILLIALLGAGAAVCVSTAWYAWDANKGFGFPLDDPWIHLQFAKNLHDFGSFSYYKNDMVTSGSTSPLYTFMLAAGFFVTGNEMLLSYSLGIAFFVLAGYFMFRLASVRFQGNAIYAYASMLLLLFEPRMQWAALSGMETTMFIALLLAVNYFYEQRNGLAFGVSSGLLLWARPEAVIFLGVIAADVVYHRNIVHVQAKDKKHRADRPDLLWLKQPIIIVCLLAAAYLAFNLILSGSPFPNTYSAKIKYYSGGGEGFPLQVFHFLVDRHMGILAPFVAIGIIRVIIAVIKRRPERFLIAFLWPLLMFIAYWKNLPYLYQEGRYLMPILPFIVLLGVEGVRVAIDGSRRVISHLAVQKTATRFAAVILASALALFIVGSWNIRAPYADMCRYISDRQVRTAHWLKQHLPETAVVATHDIGAIAFYSNKRICDMVGLVSPEMISGIGSYEKLRQFLVSSKATHLAVLRNWFEIGNEDPLFQTNEAQPEIMEVFEFDRSRTHFVPRTAGRMTEAAASYLGSGRVREASALLQQSLQVDPQFSKTYCLLASAFAASGRFDDAENALKTAEQLQPSSSLSRLVSAEIAARRSQPERAVAILDSLVRLRPEYPQAYLMLSQVYQAFHLDSLKAVGYHDRYVQLSGGQGSTSRQD